MFSETVPAKVIEKISVMGSFDAVNAEGARPPDLKATTKAVLHI